jgi:hypothetical protein
MIDLDSSTQCAITGGDCLGLSVVWNDRIVCIGLHF